MSNYIPIENRLGVQSIGASSTAKIQDLGTLIRAVDSAYGEGEFIYLLGCVGTGIGSIVTWGGLLNSMPSYQTVLAPSAGIIGQPVAVAMSVNVAGQYGWYQIGGPSVMQTNGTLAANVPVYLAGSGQATSSGSGLQVMGAVSVTASGTPASGLAFVEIDRPFASSNPSTTSQAQRRITSSAQLPILATDSVLNLALASPTAITIPTSASRNGSDLFFQDVAGTWGGANTPTFNRTGGDTFDGLTSITGQTNYGWIQFIPLNDGVSSGYKIIGTP